MFLFSASFIFLFSLIFDVFSFLNFFFHFFIFPFLHFSIFSFFLFGRKNGEKIVEKFLSFLKIRFWVHCFFQNFF